MKQYDNQRDKLYSAYVFVGGTKFRKSMCTNRGKKTGKCYDWKHEYLDLSNPEDAGFVKSSMILIGEAEL